MEFFLLSDTKRVADQIRERLRDTGVDRVLIIDGAGQDPAGRGGSIHKICQDMGLYVRVADPLTEPVPDLSAFTAIYFTGGNPFRLLKGAREAGLQALIEARDLDDPGTLTVFGSSAGAMVMGSDVAHADILAPRLGIRDATAFGWIDQPIMPHLDLEGINGDVIRKHVAQRPDLDWLELYEESFEQFSFRPEAEILPGVN